jgi:tetratricopeptide (TPR) repeat protein
MQRGGKPLLRLIGPFRVEMADEADITPSSKKAKALLAMLALAPKGARSRKWLQDKLWSDREPSHAAASLRQELSEIRRHFRKVGLDVLAIDREVVRLDLECVMLDLDAASPDATQDLLEGLDVRDPEFEDWLRDERTRWHSDVATPQRPPARPSRPSPALQGFDGAHASLRPAVGLYAEGHQFGESFEASPSDLVLDLVARCILSFDAVDVMDLRPNRQTPGSVQRLEGPDWVLHASALVYEGAVCITVNLRSVGENRMIWSQSQHFEANDLYRSENLRLGAFVNEVAFITLDQIVNPHQIRDEPRHKAARLAIGAVYHMLRLRDVDLDAAERMLTEAYETEPKSSYLGWRLYLDVIRLGERRVGRTDPFFDQARDYARRAIEADPYNPITLALTAHAHSFIFREYEFALELLNRAVAANPMLAICRDLRALTLGYLGDVERGYQDAMYARALGGPPTYRYCIETTCCILSTLQGRFEDGIKYGRLALAQQPNFLPALRYSASCEGYLGRAGDAEKTVDRIRKWEPDFSIELLRSEDYPVAGLLGTSVIEKGLAQIGLPPGPKVRKLRRLA